jgi:hypothetical protein
MLGFSTSHSFIHLLWKAEALEDALYLIPRSYDMSPSRGCAEVIGVRILMGGDGPGLSGGDGAQWNHEGPSKVKRDAGGSE